MAVSYERHGGFRVVYPDESGRLPVPYGRHARSVPAGVSEENPFERDGRTGGKDYSIDTAKVGIGVGLASLGYVVATGTHHAEE